MGKILKLRKDLNLDQEEMSVKFGLSLRQYQRIEKSDKLTSSQEIIFKIISRQNFEEDDK